MRTNQRACSLAYDASNVMLLRMFRLASGGPAAQVEARRMVEEKVTSALELQARAVTGTLGRTPNDVTIKTLSHYRGKVQANRRRLLKVAKLSGA
jgi:hypothetical protein